MDDQGPATLVVSCVTETKPHCVLPLKFKGDNCESGIFIMNIGEGQTKFTYIWNNKIWSSNFKTKNIYKTLLNKLKVIKRWLEVFTSYSPPPSKLFIYLLIF